MAKAQIRKRKSRRFWNWFYTMMAPSRSEYLRRKKIIERHPVKIKPPRRARVTQKMRTNGFHRFLKLLDSYSE